MIKATYDSSTVWISYADAVELISGFHGSAAAEVIRRRGLITGKVPWRAAELTGRRRDCDPGNGDPDFFKRENKWVRLQSWPCESRARRRVLAPVPRRRHIVLCDYQVVGIELAKEKVLELLPPAERARLAAPTRNAAREAAPAVDRPSAPATTGKVIPRRSKVRQELAAQWVWKAYPNHTPENMPAEISTGEVQRRIETDLKGPRLTLSTLQRAMGRRKN